MAIKRINVKNEEGKEFIFYFPSLFSDKNLKDTIKALRDGHPSRWTRPFFKLTDLTITEVEKATLNEEFKFVSMIDPENGSEFMAVFQKEITHAWIEEVLQHLAYSHDSDWKPPLGFCPSESIAGGFISETGNCYGYSESMNKKARAEDTELFAKNMCIIKERKNE